MQNGKQGQIHYRCCVIEGCQRKHHARGLCTTHYTRWRIQGSPYCRKRGNRRCDDFPFSPLMIQVRKNILYYRTRVNEMDCAVHRLVAEHYLGRKLRKGEVVHHKDGNGLHNAWSNLEIMGRDEHISHERHKLGGEEPF